MNPASNTKVNLFLTFDYELPLGGWAVSPGRALIEPAERLLALCDQLDVRITLFADVLAGIQFRKWEPSFEKLMRQQLQSAVEKKHDLQLHLHPHWLTSTYEKGVYSPSGDFKLSGFQEDKVEEMVRLGIDYLNDAALAVDPHYHCIAFRAGGYNIENSERLFTILKQNGILIDSSMCHGFYFASGHSVVDYRDLPDLPNWYFSPQDYRQPASFGLYEIPIAAKNKSLFEIPSFIRTRIHKERRPEFRGRMIHSENKLPLRQKYRKLLSSRMLSFDNYAYSNESLLTILRSNMERFSAFEEINLAVIAHPKSMDHYNFSLMESFITSVKKIYGGQVRFMTFRQFAYEKLR